VLPLADRNNKTGALKLFDRKLNCALRQFSVGGDVPFAGPDATAIVARPVGHIHHNGFDWGASKTLLLANA